MPQSHLTLSFSVLMKGITWSRDSHGLFDYESRHLTKRTMKAQDQMKIVRNGNDLEIVPNLGDEPDAKEGAEKTCLLKIVQNGSKFFLQFQLLRKLLHLCEESHFRTNSPLV